ncbi:hypothetical protein PVL29_000964 [Vitis rotundifolia]|uniref:Pentatricopeptide repeat-containing protein At1g26900, mitochondrial n=1 Tax=Vitis rotundifolia TaxID=103349 RepID=A0AA39AKD0_VITRO|nr:hypothetical protein PVL29_000964 [Vitis rotundifolia]
MIFGSASWVRQKFQSWSLHHFPKFYSTAPEDQSLISLLESCTQTSEICQVHGSMVKTGLVNVPFTLSKLLASSIQDIDYAASIFNHIPNPNLFMFNTMLRGYSISHHPKQAFVVFRGLRAQQMMLDQFSFIPTLKACARELAYETGRGIHGVVVRSGHGLFTNVKNALLHFYCVCGRIGDAHQLFDEIPPRIDLVSWNTLLGGYLQVSHPTMVTCLFGEMCRKRLKFSTTTISSVLCAVGDLGNILGGVSLHGHCIKVGFCSDLSVATALIDMYANAGFIDLGHKIFYSVPKKDVVLWNCLIDGYARSGLLQESLALLQLMKREQVKPNSSTLVGLLSACAAAGASGVGLCISNYVEEEQIALDAVLGTALVDMYCKCGYLEKAIDVFERMEIKDVKSWTAMISGYGVHGQAKNAITIFHRMEEEGYRPNEVAFLAVLNACSHGGMVVEGISFLEKMVREYGFPPKVEHYGCMIDLLGRAGLLEEAHNLIKSLPVEGDATGWRALLAACRVYGNVDLGERVKRVLLEIFDEHPTDSILLSSTYAIAGRLPDYTRMQEIKEEKMMKEAGCSAIEMDSHGWEHNREYGSSSKRPPHTNA